MNHRLVFRNGIRDNDWIGEFVADAFALLCN